MLFIPFIIIHTTPHLRRNLPDFPSAWGWGNNYFQFLSWIFFFIVLRARPSHIFAHKKACFLISNHFAADQMLRWLPWLSQDASWRNTMRKNACAKTRWIRAHQHPLQEQLQFRCSFTRIWRTWSAEQQSEENLKPDEGSYSHRLQYCSDDYLLRGSAHPTERGEGRGRGHVIHSRERGVRTGQHRPITR